MRGLMVKDFRLMRSQRQGFLMIAAIAVFMLIAGQDTTFLITYCMAMGMYFTLGTLSYDEYDNGYAFLFTLPVSRRGYVVEKYLFGGLCGLVIGLTAVVACGLYEQVRHPETDVAEMVVIALISMMVMFMMMAFMIPFRLKYGAEKGRNMVLVVFVCLFLGVTVAARTPAIRDSLRGAFGWLERMSGVELCAAVFVLFVIVQAVSIAVSIHIMEKKQF